MHAHVRAHWPVIEPNVRDVPAFHRIGRTTYERVVSLSTADGQPARDAVALLVWLHHSSMESFSWPTVASQRIQLLRREQVAAVVVEQHGECAEAHGEAADVSSDEMQPAPSHGQGVVFASAPDTVPRAQPGGPA